MRRARRIAGCDSGAAAVEFALVGIILVVVVIATLDFGRVLLVRHTLANAIEVASRRALIDAEVTNAALEALVIEAAPGIEPDRLQFMHAVTPSSVGLMRRLRVDHSVALMIPFIGADAIVLSISRTVRQPS